MANKTIERFDLADGQRIYCLPVQAFPALIANVFVVIDGGYSALIDTGSGLEASDADLLAGFEALSAEFHEAVTWKSLSRIIITHAHVDHYGGLTRVQQLTDAPIAIHELDRRVLIRYQERFTLTRRALANFLRHAGVEAEQESLSLAMYSAGKEFFKHCEVATVLHDGDLLDERFTVHHTPGHCPGQVCLQLGDILFSADHVLAGITPHMAPESITPSTGLEHYLHALDAIKRVPGIRLTLAGHNAPITDLAERVDQIQASHRRKLERVLHACAEPHTIAEITGHMYPHVVGYDTLLAREEIGAHVEYLDQRGDLAIANLAQVTDDPLCPPKYVRVVSEGQESGPR